MTCRNTEARVSAKALRWVMPALLTRMSMSPKPSPTAAMAASQASWRLTSQVTARARAPARTSSSVAGAARRRHPCRSRRQRLDAGRIHGRWPNRCRWPRRLPPLPGMMVVGPHAVLAMPCSRCSRASPIFRPRASTSGASAGSARREKMKGRRRGRR